MEPFVRTIRPEELGPWLAQRGVGFMRREPDGMTEYFGSQIDFDRTRGAFDGSAVVGTLRSFATELTVPGPVGLPASALTNVTVAPTHRRKGLLRSMITEDLRDSARRGEAVSILIASEFPIYGRFGYGAAADASRYEVVHDQVEFVQPALGTVELVELDTLRKEAPTVYDRFRVSQPGSIIRDDPWWDRTTRQVQVPGLEPRKGFQAIYRSPSGVVEGYVLYEGKLDFDDMRKAGSVTVEELTTATDDAYRALWGFCCSIDLTTKSVAANRSVDEVLPLLLTDGRAVRQLGRFDFLWIRILDAQVALAGRRYGGEGRVVLELIDEMGITAGRFAVTASAQGDATCTTTDDDVDLELPVASLGAVYLGGTSWSRLQAAQRVTELRTGAIETADRLFRTATTPWSTTWF